MPITFPGDSPFSEPSRQYSGAQSVGGVEKYQSLNASTISVTNINASNISTGTLSADRIAAGAITADKIASNAVTADKIEANAVISAKIAASAVTADKISVSTLSAITANLGTVTAGTINGNTINAGSGGGGLNLYGDTFSIKNSGGSEVGRMYGTGTSLRIEANTLIQVSKKINFDNTSGTGWFAPGCAEATQSSKFLLYNNIDMSDYNIDDCTTMWAYNFNNRSDRRLKKKITSIKESLDLLMMLNPKEYSLKKDDGRRHFGLIAQEAEGVLPNIVSEDDKGIKNINYIELIPLLIGAIQELNTRLVKLET